MTKRSTLKALLFLAVTPWALGCGDDDDDGKGVTNPEDARDSYLGIDLAIPKALNLGMDGFNAATSANIAPQTGTGDVQGTLVVGGEKTPSRSPTTRISSM